VFRAIKAMVYDPYVDEITVEEFEELLKKRNRGVS
jgi:hypothetical protein